MAIKTKRVGTETTATPPESVQLEQFREKRRAVVTRRKKFQEELDGLLEKTSREPKEIADLRIRISGLDEQIREARRTLAGFAVVKRDQIAETSAWGATSTRISPQEEEKAQRLQRSIGVLREERASLVNELRDLRVIAGLDVELLDDESDVNVGPKILALRKRIKRCGQILERIRKASHPLVFQEARRIGAETGLVDEHKARIDDMGDRIVELIGLAKEGMLLECRAISGGVTVEQIRGLLGNVITGFYRGPTRRALERWLERIGRKPPK